MDGPGVETSYAPRCPHLLRFIMLKYCDYTGPITPSTMDSYGSSCILVTCPSDSLFGIQCRSDMVAYGRRDMYIYCVKHKIYPTNKLIGFDRHSIKVKRTNGDIETDWCLLSEPTEMLYHSELDKLVVMIHVAKNSGDINKWIELTEFCSLNDIDYKNLQQQLITNLEKYYNVDFSLEIWNSIESIPDHSFD